MNYKTVAVGLLLFWLQRPFLPAQAAGDATAKGTAEIARTEVAGGEHTSLGRLGPALTEARRPLYRLHKSDVLEIKFTFSPEYDQTVTIRPDGFVELKEAGEIVAEGLTIPELRQAITQSYSQVLHDPVIDVVLKDFERPYFLAGGQVGRPGKYELRSRLTVAEAIAVAGGFTEQSKHSQVVLFRRVNDGIVESHVVNLKAMLASRNLDEDMQLQAGDMLFVPQNRISKIRRFLPTSTLSTFFTPAQF
jgi:polysaccharide export outer membrane protein